MLIVQEKNMKLNTYKKFKDFIEPNIGIKIPKTKKVLLETRVLKRMKALNLQTFKEYETYFFNKKNHDNELPLFIDAITTNKTDFFREIEHFNFLSSQIIPIFKDKNIKLNIWSAAASNGAEAYSLAMLLSESKLNYKILATDISNEVLNIGKLGIYREDFCSTIPIDLKKEYCLYSKNRRNKTIKMSNELRERILFKELNLMNNNYNLSQKYHIVFLRNVLIYFEKQTQNEILEKVISKLHIGGYLFLGHSETFNRGSCTLNRVGASIYQKVK